MSSTRHQRTNALVAIIRLWLAKEKTCWHTISGLVEESIECYAMIAKPTKRSDVRITGIPYLVEIAAEAIGKAFKKEAPLPPML